MKYVTHICQTQLEDRNAQRQCLTKTENLTQTQVLVM